MKKLVSVIALALCCALLLACCTPAAAPEQPAQADGPAAAAAEPATEPSESAPVEAEEAAAPTEVDTAKLANILDFIGSVTVTTEGQALSAYPGMRLLPGDSAQTGESSEAQIELDQDRLIVLEQNSEISLQQDGATSLSLVLSRGSVINDITPGGDGYTVRAGNITMGVLGTIFRVTVDGGELVIDLYEGKLTITAPELTELDGYVMSGGERVRTDGDDLITGETVSFSDMSPERLAWLQEKLAERDAQEVLDALDEYLENISATPEPPPTAEPDPTPESTPEPTEEPPDLPPIPFLPTPLPPTPVPTPELPPPIMGAPVRIESIGGCGYTFDGINIETDATRQSWTPTFEFNACEGTIYRAYIRRGGVWQMAAGPYTADSPEGSISARVEDGDILVIVSITALDGPTVPTVKLDELVEKFVGWYEIVDKTDQVQIGHDFCPTPSPASTYNYRLILSGDIAAFSDRWPELSYVYSDGTTTYTLPTDCVGADFPLIVPWFEPAESYRCLISNRFELWMLGRIVLIPGTG